MLLLHLEVSVDKLYSLKDTEFASDLLYIDTGLPHYWWFWWKGNWPMKLLFHFSTCGLLYALLLRQIRGRHWVQDLLALIASQGKIKHPDH